MREDVESIARPLVDDGQSMDLEVHQHLHSIIETGQRERETDSICELSHRDKAMKSNYLTSRQQFFP